jgi:hypothetical protein
MGRKRTIHGKAARRRTGTTWENTRSDEVRAAPRGAGEPPAPRDNGRFTRESAREAAKRRWYLANRPDFGDGVAPWMPPADALAPFDQARQDLVLQRWDELTQAPTGPVDSGVAAKLRGWGAMHAGAEYWAARFFATGDPVAYELMLRGFRAASIAEDQARDAAAWAAASRAARDDDAPWMRSVPALDAATTPTAARDTDEREREE